MRAIGHDAGVPPDSGGCSAASPGNLTIYWTWVARSSGQTDFCAREGTGSLRARLFRHGEDVVVGDTAPVPFGCVGGFGPVAPGDYDVVVESLDDVRYLIGGSLVRPEHCTGAAADQPFCSPMRVVVEPCAERRLVAVLYCDPLTDGGSCPDDGAP